MRDSNLPNSVVLSHHTHPDHASPLGAAKVATRDDDQGSEGRRGRVDPIVGRYRMSSSEGFDDFMKVLGVGMVKRKMANSVTPVNVVEKDEEGRQCDALLYFLLSIF